MGSLALLLITAAVVCVGYLVHRDWLWKHRAKQLCTRCRNVQQPARRQDGHLCCAVCGAEDPISLDSVEARGYTIRRRR